VNRTRVVCVAFAPGRQIGQMLFGSALKGRFGGGGDRGGRDGAGRAGDGDRPR